MATGALPTDLYGMLAADIGITYAVPLTTVTEHSAKLPPGRYLVQILDQGANRAWVAIRAWDEARGDDVAAAAPFFPMDTNGVKAFEFQAKPNFNDQVSARMGAGTATLYITCIERSASAKKSRLG